MCSRLDFDIGIVEGLAYENVMDLNTTFESENGLASSHIDSMCGVG